MHYPGCYEVRKGYARILGRASRRPDESCWQTLRPLLHFSLTERHHKPSQQAFRSYLSSEASDVKLVLKSFLLFLSTNKAFHPQPELVRSVWSLRASFYPEACPSCSEQCACHVLLHRSLSGAHSPEKRSDLDDAELSSHLGMHESSG